MTGGATTGGAGGPRRGDGGRRPVGVTCDRFREVVEELALGGIGDPERADLFAHSAGCPACQALLDAFALLADRLLLVAPELEPPAGFEGRVLDHLAAASPVAPAAIAVGSGHIRRPAGRREPRRPRPYLVALVGAVAVLAVLCGAFLFGRGSVDGAHEAGPATTIDAVGAGGSSGGGAGVAGPDGTDAGIQATRSGAILRADGTRSGTAMLVDEPRPIVLVTIDNPRPSGNRVTCELVLADGTAATVGTWGYDDVVGGAWAVGIRPELLQAVQMNVRDAAGGVVASAALR